MAKKPKGIDFARGVSLTKFTDGAMLQGHFKGEPILVARREDAYFAIGATCTDLVKLLGGIPKMYSSAARSQLATASSFQSLPHREFSDRRWPTRPSSEAGDRRTD
jgi:hypothetical protein